MQTLYTIPPKTRIGHIHLKVADLKRSSGFYCDIPGLELITMYGNDAAFISAGGYHHYIGLNTWYSKNAAPAALDLNDLIMKSFKSPEGLLIGNFLQFDTKD